MTAGLVVDEVPDAVPIARGAFIARVQSRRTRRSHQLMIRYCDQGEHGQQQREISRSFHICGSFLMVGCWGLKFSKVLEQLGLVKKL